VSVPFSPTTFFRFVMISSAFLSVHFLSLEVPPSSLLVSDADSPRRPRSPEGRDPGGIKILKKEKKLNKISGGSDLVPKGIKASGGSDSHKTERAPVLPKKTKKVCGDFSYKQTIFPSANLNLNLNPTQLCIETCEEFQRGG